MVVPLGWMLDDRREPAPRLFRPPAEAPTGPMVRPRPKRLKADATGSVQLQLDEFDRPTDLAAAVEEAVSEALAVGGVATVDVTDDVPGEQAEPEAADPTEVLPWQPVFDEQTTCRAC